MKELGLKIGSINRLTSTLEKLKNKEITIGPKPDVRDQPGIAKALPKAASLAPAKVAPVIKPSNELYFSGFPLSWTEVEIRVQFEAFGKPTFFKATKSNKCWFGFCFYKTKEEAEIAMSFFNDLQLDSQSLYVNFNTSTKNTLMK